MGKTEEKMLEELDNPEVVVEGNVIPDDKLDKALATNSSKAEPAEISSEPKVQKKKEQELPAISYLTEDTDVEVESQLEAESATTLTTATRVPVSALQKERRLRQDTQKRLAEAEKQLAEAEIEKQSEPELDIASELKELAGDEDELLDKKTALKIFHGVAKRVAKEVRQNTLQTVQRDYETRRQAIAAAQRKVAVAKSEQAAREKFGDFDTVVKTAIDEGVFLPEEIASIRNAANPGVALYRKSKEALSILGITVATQTKSQKPKSEEQTGTESEEENIYEAVFNKKKSSG